MKIYHRLLQSAGCLFVVAIALAAPHVAAQTTDVQTSGGQTVGGSATYDSNQTTRRPTKGQSGGSKLPAAAPSPVASVKDPWPRLDVGAVLCKSRDDLVSYQKRATGGSGPAPDCRIVATRTGVQILARDDPSHTHVALTDAPRQTGWTDVYLPAKPPN
jgi:hypothetical protein